MMRRDMRFLFIDFDAARYYLRARLFIRAVTLLVYFRALLCLRYASAPNMLRRDDARRAFCRRSSRARYT